MNTVETQIEQQEVYLRGVEAAVRRGVAEALAEQKRVMRNSLIEHFHHNTPDEEIPDVIQYFNDLLEQLEMSDYLPYIRVPFRVEGYVLMDMPTAAALADSPKPTAEIEWNTGIADIRETHVTEASLDFAERTLEPVSK